MTSAATVGCTGLVVSEQNTTRVSFLANTHLQGSNILDALLQHGAFAHVSAFTRKPLSPKDPGSRLRPILDQDSSNWPSEFSSISPPSAVFLSALGTTRAQAGSFEAQRKIDVDLNVSLAKAAKEAGVKYYVLISSAGVSKDSIFPYSKMKGELDETVQSLGFDKTVLVKPGLIVGTRTDFRGAEYALRVLANFLGRISGNRLKDFWAQDADVIGRAAVAAGLKCLDGTAPEGKTWIVDQSQILKLGRTEWGKNDN